MERRHMTPAFVGSSAPAGRTSAARRASSNSIRYVELELSGADADLAVPGLRAHLEGCPACREEYESLRALVGGESAH